MFLPFFAFAEGDLGGDDNSGLIGGYYKPINSLDHPEVIELLAEGGWFVSGSVRVGGTTDLIWIKLDPPPSIDESDPRIATARALAPSLRFAVSELDADLMGLGEGAQIAIAGLGRSPENARAEADRIAEALATSKRITDAEIDRATGLDAFLRDLLGEGKRLLQPLAGAGVTAAIVAGGVAVAAVIAFVIARRAPR